MAVSNIERRYSTGLRFLDRAIDGGIPAGDLLAITAPPSTQSELFLKHFAANRRTHYVSLLRSEDEIRTWLSGDGHTEPVTVTTGRPDEFIESPESLTEDLEPESFLVVDTVNGLEDAPRDAYLDFLDHLKARVSETDSVCVLHAVSQESRSPRRTLTLSRADFVWQLQVLTLSRQIKTQLLVTKSRHSRALTEPVDLVMTDRVRIDTSRRIS